MATEIERKFLLANEDWRQHADGGTEYRQGYLAGTEKCSLRVRMQGDVAKLNIKGATIGVRRVEYEYSIPKGDCSEMLEHLCEGPLIHKTRYLVPNGPHTWEVDVFHGENEGLVVAEIELKNENETFFRPEWLGEEVSHDSRYYNASLVNHPYKEW